MHVEYKWSTYTIVLYYGFLIFTAWNMLTDPNYEDWLRNLQIRFVPKKNSYVLDIPDPGSISNNKKAKDVHLDIICSFYGKFGHWENNCKNYLARLKQGASIVPKGVYMIQTYFLLSGSDSDTWILDLLMDRIFVIHYSDYRISKVWREVTLSFMA